MGWFDTALQRARNPEQFMADAQQQPTREQIASAFGGRYGFDQSKVNAMLDRIGQRGQQAPSGFYTGPTGLGPPRDMWQRVEAMRTAAGQQQPPSDDTSVSGYQPASFVDRRKRPGILGQPAVGTNQPGTSGTGGGNYEQIFRQLMEGKPLTLETLQQIEPMLRQSGMSLEYNGDRSMADIRLPDGRIIDVIGKFSGAEGGRTLQWHDPGWGNYGPNGPGAGMGLPPGYSTDMDPSGLAGYGAPGLGRPFTEQFQAPTGTDDPGFKFAVDQAQKVIERSAAGKGTYLTGGTMKDLANHITGMSLQAYGDSWNRARSSYLDKYNIWGGNADRTYGQLYGLSSLGQNAASMSGNMGTSYANNAGNLITGAANANAAAQAGSGAAWGGALRDLGQYGAWAYMNRGGRNPEQFNGYWG